MPGINSPSYKGLLDQASTQLLSSSDSPKIDAEVLLQSVTGKSLAWLIAHGDDTASSAHAEQFAELIEQRLQGKPIAYIVGYKEFWSLNLKVDQNVLIPRADTETLVEQALQRLPFDQPSTALDLGTGSGAIAIAVAHERPQCQVMAVDSKPEALAIARSNAELHKLNNIEFFQSSWFANLPATCKYDLIASNPPYIASSDPHLRKGDLRFEPTGALIAAEQGLADLQVIINNSANYLQPAGWVLVEHGYTQAQQVAALFSAAGFTSIELFQDINGLPRCTAARFE